MLGCGEGGGGEVGSWVSLHVMSCVFCMRSVSCAMIWLVRLCMLPTPTPDDAGDASFLGPNRAATHKADMGSRARAPEVLERAAQKEQPASQPGNANATNTVNSSVLWLGSHACARQKARKPTGKSNDRAARKPATAKQNGQHNSPTLSTAVFDGIYSVLWSEDPASPACPAALSAKMRENEPRLYPSDAF